MENAEDPDDVDEEELEQQATKITMEIFEKHYKNVLLVKPFPPQAVVAVSNIHTSTPKDSRFGELLNATSEALNVKTRRSRTQHGPGLSSLFASAQMADLQLKYMASMKIGLHYFSVFVKFDWRVKLIKIWNTVWTGNPNPIFSAFEYYVEDHPQTLGNELSWKRPEVIILNEAQQGFLRVLQLIADLTVIMANIFLLQIKEEHAVEDVIRNYPNTPAFAFIQEFLLEMDLAPLYDERFRYNFDRSSELKLVGMVAEAVELNARAAKK